jgi:hypothetical protein
MALVRSNFELILYYSLGLLDLEFYFFNKNDKKSLTLGTLGILDHFRHL